MWFRHDLRLSDNLALQRLASDCDELIVVFVLPPSWRAVNQFQSRHIGAHRLAFLQQSLQDLQLRLTERGQSLIVLNEEPLLCLPTFIAQHQVDVVASNYHPGVYERRDWVSLKNQCPDVVFLQEEGATLYALSQLPFDINDLPESFTPFRKRVEAIKPDRPCQTPTHFPPPPPALRQNSAAQLFEEIRGINTFEPRVVGGESAAQAQLAYYTYESKLLSQYKQTRNQLDGWDYSSKLSFWLANGCISPRQIYYQIQAYEADVEKNESTYWLKFELWWREYFYWYLHVHQHRLFIFSGVKGKKPLTTFWPQRFKAWMEGSTPYPIVNACMKQLKQTGYMSNRGRQLVASCLVHELNMDWRYGAAYFEEMLIDYDVASNWGNWQYLAGVGADPRGHRQFDLAKQAQQYDPNGEFVATWQGESSVMPMNVVDESDWPIT